MEKWIYAVFAVCQDPSREKEFLEWLDKIHLPDMLETPGLVRAAHYEIRNPADGQGKFLTLYDIETEDIDQTMVAMRENVAQKKKQGRMSELGNVISRAHYRQITEPQMPR
jgi:hypothetical protein